MKKSGLMPKVPESLKPPTADEIADLADRGKSISRFFTGRGKMMPPITPETKKLATSYTRYDIVGK